MIHETKTVKTENIGKNDIGGRYARWYRDDGKMYENRWKFTRVPVSVKGPVIGRENVRKGQDRVLGGRI